MLLVNHVSCATCRSSSAAVPWQMQGVQASPGRSLQQGCVNLGSTLADATARLQSFGPLCTALTAHHPEILRIRGNGWSNGRRMPLWHLVVGGRPTLQVLAALKNVENILVLCRHAGVGMEFAHGYVHCRHLRVQYCHQRLWLFLQGIATILRSCYHNVSGRSPLFPRIRVVQSLTGEALDTADSQRLSFWWCDLYMFDPA